VTFDDGFENVVQLGLPHLAQHQFRAIQFLVADRLGQTNEWDAGSGEVPARLMDAGQVREWMGAGHEIGSHSLTHVRLTEVGLGVAREEIRASKRKLEDTFGVPIRHFCYPYGGWNPAVRDLVAEAGYLTACTTDFGVNDSSADGLALRRITARYRSRNWRGFKEWLEGCWRREQ
jgi:peptidoglycan/xylan/chitin deacetylase (PgdA/CDA1 family)